MNFIENNIDCLGNVVVDIGCGNGIIDLLLARLHPEKKFYCYDLNKKGIEAAKYIQAKYGNPENLEFFVCDDKTRYEACDTILLSRLYFTSEAVRICRNTIKSFPMHGVYARAEKEAVECEKILQPLLGSLKDGGSVFFIEELYQMMDSNFIDMPEELKPYPANILGMLMGLNNLGYTADFSRCYISESKSSFSDETLYYGIVKKEDAPKDHRKLFEDYCEGIGVDPEILRNNTLKDELKGIQYEILDGWKTQLMIDLIRDKLLIAIVSKPEDRTGINLVRELCQCKDGTYAIYQNAYADKKPIIFMNDRKNAELFYEYLKNFDHSNGFRTSRYTYDGSWDDFDL